MSDKKGLLPEVTDIDVFDVYLGCLSSQNCIDELLLKLKEENPSVARYIESHANHTNDADVKYSGISVYEMLKKAGPLPQVSEDVSFVVKEEVGQSQGPDYFIQVLERMIEDNPSLANFLFTHANTCANPSRVIASGSVVYRLLESQAEADALSARFPLN